MNHASLFTGIGGFDLAAKWMGWNNIFQVEINDYCQSVLKKNFPTTHKYHDIKKFNGEKFRGAIDVLSGGFPCQPYSTAGKRKGKNDERHLWPEMLRVIHEISPRWIVGENVRGLVSWNGGMVFDEVQSDLEAEGYEVTPFILPAAGVNAPHRRYRVWFIAYSGCRVSDRRQDQQTDYINNGQNSGRSEKASIIERLPETGIITHSDNTAPERQRKHGGQILSISETEGSDMVHKQYPAYADIQGLEERQGQSSDHAEKQPPFERSGNWGGAEWPTQSPVCGGDDGISNRMDRIAALGNAVVPQIVYRIFECIKAFENETS